MTKAKGKLQKYEIELPLVGFNHRAVAQTRREIAMEVPLSVELRREPENVHDPNAVAVYVLEEPWRELHIGYVPRAVVALIAHKMDKGKFNPVEAWLTEAEPEGGTGTVRVKYTKRKR